MSQLLWPGDERAGPVFAEPSVLTAMVRVEAAWLRALVAAGVAPEEALDDLERVLDRRDLPALASGSEASGNPVVPMLRLLRERLGRRNPAAATWVHRGLTSQDVLDTALVLCAQETTRQLLAVLDRQVTALVELADRHRDSVMAGRTLTQHAVPISFGLKAATWLQGLLDARDALRRLRFPVQLGGAAGTLSAVVELLTSARSTAGPWDVVSEAAATLGLSPALPWHTCRAPFTTYADALVTTTDALGHLADDVLLLARPEIGELAEPVVEGRGGSSTMPQKANPVLSVLVRRAAVAGPGLAAQLHLAAAGTVDERPDGAWHTEWSALATLSRRTLVAASQAAELVEGLHVDTGRMAAVVRAQASALLAEQRSVRALVQGDDADQDFDPSHYLGATRWIIEEILDRARKETP